MQLHPLSLRLCRIVYDLCAGHGEVYRDNARALRLRFLESIETNLAETELPALLKAKAVGHAAFLAAFKIQRGNHILLVRKLSVIFRAANHEIKNFHLRQKGLVDVGNRIFQTRIFDEMKDDIVAAILALIRKNRGYVTNHSSSIDKSSIMDFVAEYQDWGGCLCELREAVVTDTRAYYTSKRSDWISGVDYYVKVKSAMEMEQKWFKNSGLLENCAPKVKNMMEEEMLDNKEIVSMFAELYLKLRK